MKTLLNTITTALRIKKNRIIVDDVELVPIEAYEKYLKEIAMNLMEMAESEVKKEDIVKLAREILKNTN